MASKYVVCVVKEYAPGKRKFTEVGVGFPTQDNKGISIQLDLTLILSPSDSLFVLLRRKGGETYEQQD